MGVWEGGRVPPHMCTCIPKDSFNGGGHMHEIIMFTMHACACMRVCVCAHPCACVLAELQ